MPFQFKRLQLPVRLCFAMSINKSQGQSLRVVGVDLKNPCFSHDSSTWPVPGPEPRRISLSMHPEEELKTWSTKKLSENFSMLKNLSFSENILCFVILFFKGNISLFEHNHLHFLFCPATRAPSASFILKLYISFYTKQLTYLYEEVN
jgi:hypothetical protein